MGRAVKYGSLGFVLTVLVAFGQNCQRSSLFSTESQRPVAEESPGNGQGYSGKIYVHLLKDGLCEDQSKIESRIEIRGEFAQLTRANCSELAPATWQTVATTLDPNDSSRLTYNGVVYLDAATIGVASPPRDKFSLALNFGGQDLVIDQKLFGTASRYGVSGNVEVFEQQSYALTPATDANRLIMIRSSLWGGYVVNGYTITLPLPNGDYEFSYYTWEETVSVPYSLALQGTTIENGVTPAVGTWEKRGPYKFSVQNGVLTIESSTNELMISGIEIEGSTRP